jgi:hypothetical protein
MWSTLSRARRRLGGVGVAPPAETGVTRLTEAPADADERAEAAPSPRPVEDVAIVLGRAEIDRLRHALQRALGDAVEPPNTPARIEHALGLILDLAGSPGHARVLRRPAGVSTPESWEIHLDGAEHASGIAVREAGRTGRFVP